VVDQVHVTESLPLAALPLFAGTLTLVLLRSWLALARRRSAELERLELERRHLVEQLAAEALKRKWGEENRSGVVHVGRITRTTVDRRTTGERLAGMRAPALELAARLPQPAAPTVDLLERRDLPAGYTLARHLPEPLWRRWYARQLEAL
jgi:hypothetical protein